MDERRTGVALHLRRLRLARRYGRRATMQGGAVTADRGELGFDRALGHDDVAGDATGARGQRQRAAMVAGGMGDHATRGAGVVQRPDGVARAAELERTGALQRFALEVQFAAGQRVQVARTQHRGDVGMRGDPGGGGKNVPEAGQLSMGKGHVAS